MKNKIILLVPIIILFCSVSAYSEEEEKKKEGHSTKREVEATITEKERGILVSKACAKCHLLKKPKVTIYSHKVGPSLVGILDRPIGSLTGYDYSAAIRRLANEASKDEEASEALQWTKENLMAYLYNPVEFLQIRLSDKKVRGKMGYRLNRIENRKALIKRLEEIEHEDDE